jgi:hypothetical protein
MAVMWRGAVFGSNRAPGASDGGGAWAGVFVVLMVVEAAALMPQRSFLAAYVMRVWRHQQLAAASSTRLTFHHRATDTSTGFQRAEEQFLIIRRRPTKRCGPLH